MRILPRDGLSLAWYDTGGQGPAFIFQHGLGGDANQTREAFPDDPRFRRITLECRGHGASQRGAPISLAAFAEDLIALIESEGLAPVVVGGISMGAALATRLAVTRPDLVRALVLVRPAWIAEEGPDNLAPNIEVGRLLAELPPAEARAAFLESSAARLLRLLSPDNLNSLTGFFDRPDPEGTSLLLRTISADGPGISRTDLSRIAVPALVLGTEKDAIHPLALAETMAGLLPRSRYATLTPKGSDKPRHLAELRSAITAFLQEL